MLAIPIVALGLAVLAANFAPALQRPLPGISLAEYGNSGGAGGQNIGLPGAGSTPIVTAAQEWRVLLFVGLGVFVVVAVVAVVLLARRRRATVR